MTSNIPAVIIAAGRGSRLESLHNEKPKTLLQFDEKRRIIDIILEKLRSAGISEVIIVIGYQGHKLREALGNGSEHGVHISYVENPEWQKPNGLSVLAASEAVGNREFILTMSDHLFEAKSVQKLLDFPLENNGAVVAVDTNIAGIHDIDDAMKIQVRPSNSHYYITRMDKSLGEYDAVDCGLFKGTSDLFQALTQAAEQGKQSLSNGCEELIAQDKMFGCDITGEFWIDVDTPSALEAARERWKHR